MENPRPHRRTSAPPRVRRLPPPAEAGSASPLADPVADWLDTAADYAARWPPDRQTNSPFRRDALTVACVINGTRNEETSTTPESGAKRRITASPHNRIGKRASPRVL